MSRNSIIVSKNCLLAEGIRSLLAKDHQDISFVIAERIDLKEITRFSIMIVDSAVLSESAAYIFERIRTNSKSAIIILLSQKIPNEQVQPYIDAYILFADSAEIIQDKLGKVIKRLKGSEFQSTNDSLLSERENEVLRYVALGYINRDISDELAISTHTVITHRKNITAKLGIKTIAGLAVYAVINGIISSEEMNA